MQALSELIRRAQTGDPEAYGQIVARFQDMAYGYAHALLNDFHLAQDAAQEAFIEAYYCLPTLRQPLAFPVWFKRIVFKHCDRLTRRKSLVAAPLEAVEWLASPVSDPSDLSEARQAAEAVQQAVQALPEAQRVVTTLFYIDGYSHQEIAAFLDLPPQTVKSRLHASRQRLKERMLSMVQEDLRTNALSQTFTAETVEQAVLQAAALNQERQFDQAETLLRQVLAQVPRHPGALKALNRALMQGRVYAHGRWDLLAELARQGRLILASSADEESHRQVAQTLLAIPAMSEAIAFLEAWIAARGETLERLGMLAWARGCAAEYAAAEILWERVLSLAQRAQPSEALSRLPFIAYTLVDCFSAAGDLPQAQRIARQAWDLCGRVGELPAQGTFSDDSDWLLLWRQAGLQVNEILPTLVERHQDRTESASQAIVWCLRSWESPPAQVQAQWLNWAGARCAAGEFSHIEAFRFAILRGFRAKGLWQAANCLAQATWELLGESQSSEAEKTRRPWDWERFNPVGAIEQQDWAAAQAVLRQEIQARGVQGAVGWAAVVAAGSGMPTPPEFIQAIDQQGVSAVDDYGMAGWYLVAREAAAAGDADKAFAALHKALSYWSNAPYWITDIWEKDAYWGALRDHPDFKRAFDARRQRIGPIKGRLHYFPGW